jgi:hypothetical protein
MAVNYTNAVKDARLEAVRTALNANGGGSIVITTSAPADLCEVPLETVIGAPVNGVLTIIATPKQGTATGAGTAALARLEDGAATAVATGLTVGTSASFDVQLNDLAFVVGSQVTLNSGTITSP